MSSEQKKQINHEHNPELNINPRFKNLVPDMSDEEFAQLEKNIVDDGEIREPIVVWNGTIIDGHHRYQVAQAHPDIPFTITEKTFDSEDEVCLWICDNQLGRRNLTDKDRTYLLGAQAKMAEKVNGGTGANQYTKEQVSQNETPAKKPRGTTGEIAQNEHVSRATVNRAIQFKKGVDVADSISPGLGKKIRSGEKKVTKQTMENLAKADPETQKKVVKDIKEGNEKAARRKLDPWSEEIHKAEGDTREYKPKLKRDSEIVSDESEQEAWLNRLREACQDFDERLQVFLDNYASADMNDQEKSEAMIILNDMKETIQTAIEEIGKADRETQKEVVKDIKNGNI